MKTNNNDQTRLIEYLIGLADPPAASELEAAAATDPALHEQLETTAAEVDLLRQGLDQPPAAAARQALLEAAGGGFEALVPRVGAFLNLDERHTRVILEAAKAPTARWTDERAPGVSAQSITAGPRHRGATATLLRLEPGAEISRHRHLGAEWGFVLDGRLTDDQGDLKAAGDIVYKSAGSVHRVWNPGARPAVAINIIHTGYDWDPQEPEP